MKIYSEVSLPNFQFWSGAKENANMLTYDQLEQVESALEDIYPDGANETDINDLFWFDFDTVLEWIGCKLNDAGEIVDADSEEEIDEDE